jgi:hypothetical protein
VLSALKNVLAASSSEILKSYEKVTEGALERKKAAIDIR